MEEIFSQAISQSSPRCRRCLWIGYKLAGVSFLQNGRSRISRLKLPAGSVGQFAKECKVECGLRLVGLARLEGSNWTSLDHMDATRKSIPNNVFVDSEEQCGPTQEWGWCFSRKARRSSKSQTIRFENVDIEEAPNGTDGCCVERLRSCHHYRDGNTKPMALYRCEFGWNHVAKDGACGFPLSVRSSASAVSDSLIGNHSPSDPRWRASLNATD